MLVFLTDGLYCIQTHLVFKCLELHFWIRAKYAGSLSHLQLDHFHNLVPGADEFGLQCPQHLWGPGLTHVGLAIGKSLAPSTWADYNTAWRTCNFLDSQIQNLHSFSERLVLSFLKNCNAISLFLFSYCK